MNRNLFLSLIGIILMASCTEQPTTPAAAPVISTATPENYGLYTDSDLQIYADMIDLRIQQALKNNNISQAQELGRKRQELIAEFNRRGLKRKSAEPTRHPHYSRPANHPERGRLPGED